jgi:hypothetical protein
MPVRLQISVRNGELVRKDLEDLSDKDAPKVSAGRIFGRLEGARKRVTRYPPKFQGPYPWVSDKQRRYVMMMIRRGVIKVPYERTFKYRDAWRIIKTERGYALVGRAAQKGREYTKYVSGSAYGTNQARIHQGRWTPLRDAVEEAVSRLPKEIADDIVMVARRRGYEAK